MFTYTADHNLTLSETADHFIRSPYLAEALTPGLRANPASDPPYLRPAFDLDKISYEDFKQSDFNGIVQFLVAMINDPSWGDDRKEFSLLLDYFLAKYKDEHEEAFFFINKDWFKPGDPRINSPEDWVYGYYIIIISIDSETKKLTVSELSYD